VSVIIPTCDRVHLVREAIQSVMDQTYTDWELIVVDDGSTDDTARVVAQFGERVHYIYQSNSGEPAARNAGLPVARGELVSFLDSDDCMLPHNLETLVGLLDNQPEVDVAYGWYYLMDPGGRPFSWQGPDIEADIPQQVDHPWPEMDLRPSGTTMEGHVLAQLMQEETMMMGSVLVRRRRIDEVGGFDRSITYQPHWDFFLRLARAGCVYACSRQGVVLLRRHPGDRGQNQGAMLACRIAILDRLFADPDVSTSLATVRPLAYNRAWAEYAGIYYASDMLDAGSNCLRQALRQAPLRPYDLLVISEQIVRHAFAGEAGDPLQFARSLLEPLHGLPHARPLRSCVRSRVHMETAFRHYRAENLRLAWQHALGAIIHERALLRNRGLGRILLEGALGARLFDWLRSKQSPSSEQFLVKVARTTCIFVSPHLDDVVWSCGGTLAHLVRRGARVLLVTVFTADRPEGVPLSPLAQKITREWGDTERPFKFRQGEEQAAVQRLGISYRWLGFLDCVYRYPQMSEPEICIGGFQPRADAVFKAVRAALQQIVEAYPGAVVFGPLGLGYHRDHLLVCEALQDIRSLGSTRCDYYCYEDFPYAAQVDVRGRLSELGGGGSPQTVDIEETLGERVELMAMYASQVGAYLGGRDGARRAVVAYTTHVGSRSRPRERFWSLRSGAHEPAGSGQ